MKKPKAKKLSARVRRFIIEYPIDQNGTKAAERSGFSPKCAHVQASRLLRNANIRAEINKRIAAIAEKSDITIERVMKELGRLAFVDIRQAYDAAGNLLPMNMMPEDIAAAIAGSEVFQEFEGAGRERYHIGDTKKLKLWDKTKALEMLGKRFKMFTDVVQHDVSDGLAERLDRARKRMND